MSALNVRGLACVCAPVCVPSLQAQVQTLLCSRVLVHTRSRSVCVHVHISVFIRQRVWALRAARVGGMWNGRLCICGYHREITLASVRSHSAAVPSETKLNEAASDMPIDSLCQTCTMTKQECCHTEWTTVWKVRSRSLQTWLASRVISAWRGNSTSAQLVNARG